VLRAVHQAARMSKDVEARRRGLDRRLSGAGDVHQSKQQAARMSEDVEARRRGLDRGRAAPAPLTPRRTSPSGAVGEATEGAPEGRGGARAEGHAAPG
jgi:hypothetical protein